MKENFNRVFYIVLLFCILLTPLKAENQQRFRYMGSTIFTMPTGYTRSTFCYINDNSHSATLLTQSLMAGFLELDYLRHMNGAEEGKSIMSAKLKILDEGVVLPSVVWGVSDINTQLGSRVFYFAASKAIEAFGLTIHGGFYKDPSTTKKQEFFGIEKMIFPLVTVGAERDDNKDTFGIKLSPYPGLSLEFGQRDHEEEFYNVNYIRSF